MAAIIISQLSVANRFDLIGDKTVADAILDRLIHTTHRAEFGGESMRKNH